MYKYKDQKELSFKCDKKTFKKYFFSCVRKKLEPVFFVNIENNTLFFKRKPKELYGPGYNVDELFTVFNEGSILLEETKFVTIHFELTFVRFVVVWSLLLLMINLIYIFLIQISFSVLIVSLMIVVIYYLICKFFAKNQLNYIIEKSIVEALDNRRM